MVRTQFRAQHFFPGKEFGQENSPHSHDYLFEIEIANHTLNQFNFLIDILAVKKLLNDLKAQFNNKLLNDLPEFKNQYPSLEFFSKILWQKFTSQHYFPITCQITVSLWEDEIAKASYRE